MLLKLDKPCQVAEVLENQGKLVNKRIIELQEVSKLITALRGEVLQISSVDFEKYANIVGMLKMENEFYWVLKLLDDDLKNHSKERFTENPELGIKISNTYKAVLDEAVILKNSNEPPQSERSMALAKKWWDMVQEFTGGDISIPPNLLEFNDDKSGWNDEIAGKQAQVDDYIGEALMNYFSQNNISVPETC